MSKSRSIQLLLLIACAFAASVRAQDAASGTEATAAASDAGAPATALQAIFMEVEGKVRWRPSEKAAWKDAAVNDLVSAGAEIRTGLRSRAGLRVGKNATVLVDAGTTFQLPTVVQEGETLRTLAAVKSGRVDFKVDKVGFSNDFKVVTPQTTLSVRGTGFGVSSGPLTGVQVTGARTNAINAIELRYVSSNLRYFLSGSANSSSSRPDPVQNAWLGSLGPPQIAGLIADPKQLEQAASQGQTGNNPVNPQQLQQQAAAQSMDSAASSAVDDLLRLEARSADQIELLAGGARAQALAAEPDAGSTIPAANAQQQAIAAVFASGEQLRDFWIGNYGDGGTGGGGTTGNGNGDFPGDPTGPGGHGGPSSLTASAQSQMLVWRAQSGFDLESATSLRESVDAALAEGSVSEVTSMLDVLGSLDDAWQSEAGGEEHAAPTLKQQVAAVVDSLTSLNVALQSSMSVAERADGDFNALFSRASDQHTLARTTAEPLSQLQRSVQGYQQAVAQALGAGTLSAQAAQQLRRSVELLQQSQARIAAAVAAMDAVSAKLAEARGISQRVLLAAARVAAMNGTNALSEAIGLKGEIDANIAAIESARFGAFFAAAAAGVAEISDPQEGLIETVRVERTLAENAADQSDTASAQAQSMVQTKVDDVVRLAVEMDQFWNGSNDPSFTLPAKVRMEQLLATSVEDRNAMSGMLGQLQLSIDDADQSGASLFLGDMQVLDQKWNGPSVGLLAQAEQIHAQMVGRMLVIDQRFSEANGARSDYDALLQQANARRDASSEAYLRIIEIQSQLANYQHQYEELVAAGRGGSEAATRVAQARAELDGLSQGIESARLASEAAAAAAERAGSYGQRVLLSAAANKHAQAATMLGESVDRIGAIRQNAQAIGADYADGLDRYNRAFPNGGGR